MSYALYLAGFVIFVGGVAWALARAGLNAVWIVIISVILLGIGMVKAVTHTRPKDPVS
jgi:energy-converting hydrogenase Eha subunit C